MKKKYLLAIFYIFSTSVLSAESLTPNANAENMLMVHKTPTCGCCSKWIEHLNMSGLKTSTQNHENLENIKKTYGIKPEYRSCHTGVSEDGYIFEGHIPSQYITQFLSEDHPNAIGLSVPGMPLGSPGMEVGNRFMPYDVLILYKDGTSRVFAEIRKD